MENLQPDNGPECGAGVIDRPVLTADGRIGSPTFNPDNRLSRPWERRKDESVIGLTEAYCKDLEKVNGVSGIGTEYLPRWIRNPNGFEGDDRPAEIAAEMPGAFCPKPPKGKGDYVSNGVDRILALLPRRFVQAEVDAERKQIDLKEQGAKINSAGEYERMDSEFAGRDPQGMSVDDKYAYARQMAQQNRENHLIGPTAGLGLLEATARQRAMAKRGMGPTPEEEEARYRKGGRAVPLSDSEYAAMMHKLSAPTSYERSEATRIQRESGRGGRSFAVGAGPAVAPGSSLAQARARAGREGK